MRVSLGVGEIALGVNKECECVEKWFPLSCLGDGRLPPVTGTLQSPAPRRFCSFKCQPPPSPSYVLVANNDKCSEGQDKTLRNVNI